MQIQNSSAAVLVLLQDLLEFVGFNREVTMRRKINAIGRIPSDVNRGLNLLYVYCDVESDVLIGDSRASLLRVCNTDSEHCRIARVIYVRPHHVPVGRCKFDAIKTSINNELGRPMPFEFGRWLATLHFRRR